jgi:protein-disulfide isomerase
MRSRLTAAIIAIIAVAIGGVIYALVADGIGKSPIAEAAPETPIPVAQATPIPAADTTGVFNEAEQAAINQMIADYLAANADFIRDYLIANPEVLQEVVNELDRRRTDQIAQQQAQAIDDYRELIFDSTRQVVLGNPNGDVTLVEFFDYNCPYCKAALGDMNRLVTDDPNLRIVLKEFPVLGAGSTEAAQVAVAVDMLAPDLYGQFHQLLLGSSAQADGDLAIAAAEEVGLNADDIRALMDTPEVSAVIQESYTLADALGLTGTPSYVLGNSVIVGAVGYDSLRQMIDSVRACGQTTCNG